MVYLVQPDSPRVFYDDISIYLLSVCYYILSVDQCFFYKRVGDRLFKAIVHFDDFAIAGDSMETVNDFVNVELFLGINIRRTKDESEIFSQFII